MCIDLYTGDVSRSVSRKQKTAVDADQKVTIILSSVELSKTIELCSVVNL